MKKLLLFLLISVLLLVGCQTAETPAEHPDETPAEPLAENNSPDVATLLPEEQETLEQEAEIVYPKIHFYFVDNNHTTIDDAEELSEATAWLNSNQKENEVQISVQFVSNFVSNRDYGSERANLKSIEDVRAFRESLNSDSKKYHDDLVAQHMGLLSDFKYNSVTHIDYSPFVTMYINANEITMENLEKLSASDAVASICVSYIAEAVPD